MAHHPQAVAEATASFIIVRDLWRIAVALASAFALVGCTLFGVEPPPPNAPTLSAEQFPGLADRDADIVTSAEGLAADGSDAVALVEANGRISLPTFWHSIDAGVSWTRGRLSAEAAEATEIAEDVLGHAAVSVGEVGRRWLGLGRKGRDLIAWTSTDAQTWERSVVAGIDVEDMGINEVLGSPSGFLMVGDIWDAAARVSRPAAWTSPDGVSWSRDDLPGEGVLLDVARHEDTVVAVERHEPPATTEEGRAMLPLLFVSTDGGASWSAQEVPEPSDSDAFFTTLTDVVWTPDGFVVGGSYFTPGLGGHRAWTLESPDGTTWKPGASIRIKGDQGWVSDLVQSDGETVLVHVWRTPDATQLEILTRTEPGSWTRAERPFVDGTMWLTDAVVSGRAVLLGVASDNTLREDRLWAHRGCRGRSCSSAISGAMASMAWLVRRRNSLGPKSFA